MSSEVTICIPSGERSSNGKQQNEKGETVKNRFVIEVVTDVLNDPRVKVSESKNISVIKKHLDVIWGEMINGLWHTMFLPIMA